MLNELYNTTITRLTIHAPAHLQENVRRELQQADWPDGGSEQIIFVRKLSATAPHTEIGRLLLHEATHQVRHSNDSENVIRFANHMEMLAALLADLASGLAAGRWYWQRWKHLFSLSTSRALYSVLVDNLTQLNALTETLARQRQLENVWRKLAEEDTKQLIDELSWKNGYTFSDGSNKPTDINVPLQIPKRILQRWKHVLVFAPASNRFRLATVLIAQEHAPLALIRRADFTLSVVTLSLTKLQHTDQHSIKSQGIDASTSTKHNQERLQDNSGATVHPYEKSSHQKKPHLSDSKLVNQSQPEHTEKSPKLAAISDTQNNTPKASKKVLPPYAENGQKRQPQSPVEAGAEIPFSAPHPLDRIQIQTQPEITVLHSFVTEQGGVLYLLNFLNRPPLQAIMEKHWRLLPNCWTWLYRLAELLNFNDQDPMAHFLVEQLGLESVDDLDKMPILPELEHIELLAEQWYGKTGVWHSTLLSLPARISYTASHIDMYSALSNVRLDLRLTGLDINPGWLPWLGRVVQFHFDQHGGLYHE